MHHPNSVAISGGAELTHNKHLHHKIVPLENGKNGYCSLMIVSQHPGDDARHKLSLSMGN
jgi:hypothetical protein